MFILFSFLCSVAPLASATLGGVREGEAQKYYNKNSPNIKEASLKDKLLVRIRPQLKTKIVVRKRVWSGRHTLNQHV